MSENMNVPVSVELASDSLNCDDIVVVALRGAEAISQPYRFELTLAVRDSADTPPPTVDALLGTTVALKLRNRAGEVVRNVHGTIMSVQMQPPAHAHYRMSYQVVLMPQLWALTMVKMQEVFQDLSVPQIVDEKLSRCGLEGYAEWGLLETYPAREFVVQYDETDLAFLNRLTEHLGISYFFEQHDNEERLLFTDYPDGFMDGGAVRYNPNGASGHVFGLVECGQFVPRQHVVHDYNYRTPRLDLLGVDTVEERSIGGSVEYGSHHKTPEDAEHLARVRAQESTARHSTFTAQSHAATLRVGARITLTDHERFDELGLLITRIEHSMRPGEMGGAGAAEVYLARFDAALSTTPYRPPRVTPRPRIAGVLTGMIQPGPDGALGGFARLDELGRYTVQFHFDTNEPGEQKASRPVRMAQAFAGARQGMHFPLRPGTEVLLAFAHGDPDRPVILSAIPNGVDVSPVASTDSNINRIATGSGTLFEISDGR